MYTHVSKHKTDKRQKYKKKKRRSGQKIGEKAEGYHGNQEDDIVKVVRLSERASEADTYRCFRDLTSMTSTKTFTEAFG
jgi:transcription initiation factor IIF auxiliary subunit